MGSSYSFIWPKCGLRGVGPGVAGEGIVKCLPANLRRAPSVGPTTRQVRGLACPGTEGFPGSDHILSIDRPQARQDASVCFHTLVPGAWNCVVTGTAPICRNTQPPQQGSSGQSGGG